MKKTSLLLIFAAVIATVSAPEVNAKKRVSKVNPIINTCPVGQVFTDSYCIEVDTNCARANTAMGQCHHCNKGFVPGIYGSCMPIETNCTTANTAMGECKSCKYGFVLNSIGNCLATDPNCDDPNPPIALGACQTCKPNTYPTNAGCMHMPPSSHCNGVDFFSKHCTSCVEGYTLTNAISKYTRTRGSCVAHGGDHTGNTEYEIVNNGDSRDNTGSTDNPGTDSNNTSTSKKKKKKKK